MRSVRYASAARIAQQREYQVGARVFKTLKLKSQEGWLSSHSSGEYHELLISKHFSIFVNSTLLKCGLVFL